MSFTMPIYYMHSITSQLTFSVLNIGGSDDEWAMKRNHGLDTFKSNYGMKKPKLIGGDSKGSCLAFNHSNFTLKQRQRGLSRVF